MLTRIDRSSIYIKSKDTDQIIKIDPIVHLVVKSSRTDATSFNVNRHMGLAPSPRIILIGAFPSKTPTLKLSVQSNPCTKRKG